MPDRLREFVYLDDISVNSHLSSLGEGKPQEIVDVSEKTRETSGGGDVKILSGSHARGTVDSTETQMSATAPYRFERLRNKLEEEEIPIVDNPRPREVDRGTVVRISGKFNPMSLYKIEIAVTALLDLVDEETMQSVSETDFGEESDVDSEIPDPEEVPGSREASDDSDDNEAIQALYRLGHLFEDLAGELIGDSVPIRIDYNAGGEDEYSVVTLLDRDKFDIPHIEAFFEEKEYVIFGRVDERIPRNEEWDPVRASNIFGQYFQDEDPNDFQDDWEEAAESMGLSLESDDLVVPGRSLVIYPIAVYW
jgi:hypothetical protein